MDLQKNLRAVLAITLLIGLTLILSSCGGGGGGTSTGGYGMISGTASKGPVHGATVTAFAINSGTKGAQIGSGTTDAMGNFSVSIGGYSGSVMLMVSGGTYTNEATNTSMTMYTGDVMTAVIQSMPTGSTMTGIHITPLTSMAQARAQNMAGGMTATNISAANTAVGNYFTVSDILLTQPMDPLVLNSGNAATQDMKNYGMVLAAMSQEALDLGMPHSSGMVTAMMADASDGVMNGTMGGTPISMTGMGGMMGGGMMSSMTSTAGTSGLAAAMTTFMSNTSVNNSGVNAAAMGALTTKLNSSNGTIQ